MAINRYRVRRRKALRSSKGSMADNFVILWRYLRPVLRIGLVVGAVVGILYTAWNAVQDSPYFVIRSISIQSIPHMGDEEILKRVGLAEKRNIFRFDAPQAQVDLLSHPWVAQAYVEKSLPDRVSIRLTERKPVGVLVMKRLFFVDMEGRPFIEVSPEETSGFPLVTGFTQQDLLGNVEQVQSQIRLAISVANLYTSRPMARGWPLGSVAVGVGGRINLMVGRTRVGLGTSEFKIKLERLSQIYRALKRRKVSAEYILFGDDPSRVTVKESILVGGEKDSFSLNATGARK